MTAAEKRVLELTQELTRRILNNPERKLLIIQEYYDELVRAGDSIGAAIVLTIRPIAEERMKQNDNGVPSWFPIAGYIAGICTLLFFMALVIIGVLGKEIPQNTRFIVIVVMALGLALSFAFIGGSAAASGKLPVFKNSPVKFSAGGGIAVFVIVLLLGKLVYM
jgi:hypothetical protein